MHPFSQMQIPLIAAIEKQFPDIKINPNPPVSFSNSQPLYIHTPNPPLSIGELRYIAQAISQLNPNEANTIANRIMHFITNLIGILENNEQCRLSWTVGAIRGRLQRDSKINLPELQREISRLNQLINQCKYGVKCKSQLTALLSSRRKQIFVSMQTSHLQRNIGQLYLPEMPQNYQHLPLLNEDSYQLIYESIIQKLLTYQNAIGQYLNHHLTFTNLQQICYELMRQDIVLINNNKTNELIKYTWMFCINNYQRFMRVREKIGELRYGLVQAVIRCYYVAFIAQKDIEELNQALERVQSQVMAVSTQGVSLGRNSVVRNGTNIEDIVVRLQNKFTCIFSFLTEKNQVIFTQFYERKLVKRVVKLLKIEDRLTHFFKILFNPDYADQNKSNLQRNPSFESTMQKKLSQLHQFYSEMKPITEKSFKILFSQIQQLAMYLQQQNGSKEWQYKLSQFERILMNDYLFDQKGQRRIPNNSHGRNFAKSRVNDIKGSRGKDRGNLHHKSGVNDHNRSFNSLEITKEEVFQDTFEEFKYKDSRVLPQQVDKYEVYKQGKEYLLNIHPQFGYQLSDLTNFKVFFLPKIIKKTEIALSKTPYSQQPLYLQLVSLVSNLNILSSIIKPQLNQQKFHLIFYPKVNSSLFSMLKAIMLKHQQEVSQVYVQQTNDAIKSKNLPQNLKILMQNRLKYIHFILDHLIKMQNLIISIDSLGLKKHNYDITNQGTYQLILKLLLAEKELKANQKAITDQLTNKDLSVAKGINLLINTIYPNFINSLLIIFQINQTNSLQNLLDICDSSNKTLTQSQQYFETMLKMTEDLIANRLSLPNILQEWRIALGSYQSKIDQLINKCNQYSCVNAEVLMRQRIRVMEFIELVQNGPQTRADIIDEKANKFRQRLRLIPT